MVSRLWDKLRPSHSSESGPMRTEARVRLIVGLGNPGSEYARNRHNMGFQVIDHLGKAHGISVSRRERLYVAGEGEMNGRRVALAKPLTYVNRSGDAVVALIRQFKLDDAKELLVVCDDLDMEEGKIRLRADGRHGGQKGLKSIVERLGTEDFPRLKIGIGRPIVGGKPTWDPEEIREYVLSNPPPAERELLDRAVERAAATVERAVEHGVEEAIRRPA